MGKISILMYHQVGEFPRPAAHRSTYCHIRRFKAQMAWLRHFRYRVIGLDQAFAALSGEKPVPDHAVVLTFDDGCEDFNDYVLPVLRRYNFPATVFPVAGLLGRESEWFAAQGREAPKIMDGETLRQLRQLGILVGGHTMTHPRLSRIGRAEMKQEIVQSKEVLEDLLGESLDFFCYPYGDFDTEITRTVREAGYRCALSCIRGSATGADDPFLLPRKAISWGDSLAGFFWKLHMKHKKKPTGPDAPKPGCC